MTTKIKLKNDKKKDARWLHVRKVAKRVDGWAARKKRARVVLNPKGTDQAK